jgi:hypothetical protein
MHLQPVFRHHRAFGGAVAAGLFERGLCLPSGAAMTDADLDRVCDVIAGVHRAARTRPRGPGAPALSESASELRSTAASPGAVLPGLKVPG